MTWAACDTVLTGIYRHTPAQLALELSRAALAAQGVSVAGALVLESIAALVSNRARDEAALPYFGPVADRPRFARVVLRTITELRLEYIAPHQLRQFEGAPADLAILVDAFEAELAERDVADLAMCMRTATDVLSFGRHTYCGAAVMLLCPALQYRAEKESRTSGVHSSPRARSPRASSRRSSRLKGADTCTGGKVDSAGTPREVQFGIVFPQPHVWVVLPELRPGSRIERDYGNWRDRFRGSITLRQHARRTCKVR